MSKWGPGTTIQVTQSANVPPGQVYLLNTANIATTNTSWAGLWQGPSPIKPTRKKALSWGATEAEQG